MTRIGKGSSVNDRTILPIPDPVYDGPVYEDAKDPRARFEPITPLRPPAGAPNVLVVLLDDVGFGASSAFGGPCRTPVAERLAHEGLSYSRFHTTALCAPTRQALLTGRNHHAVGMGAITEVATSAPGYTSVRPHSAAPLAQVLRLNGYATSQFGKCHEIPVWQTSPVGPFDAWPTGGGGFEHFFGFLGGETNQYAPALYDGTTAIEPDHTAAEGYHFTEDMTDRAIAWVRQLSALTPDRPFFMYYATGTAHAPLQAPADWIARFKGKFAGGYDRMREEVVERQKRMGLVPADTVNTPRPEEIAAWDALTPEQKKINERFMEVYAAMLAYQDEQVGRLFAEIGRMGLRDNTLVIFIEGDNGAAAEGGMHGSMNPMSNFANGTQESEATLLANLERIGGPEAVAQYGYGWTWATNAPFRLAKQYASHLGGTRNGMVVSWPQRIKSSGIRPQFSHVTDIAPTIYEAAGVTAPDTVNGVEQQPIDGSSLLYAFDNAAAAERHDTQYFEMMGNQAIYHQGWLASSTPAIAPWARDRRNDTLPSQYPWELYDLRADFSQAHDLASAHPEKLAQMKALFLEEARRNQVLPLDNRLSMERFLAASSQHRKADRYTYWGAGVSVPAVSAAPILNRSFTISAELDVPAPAQGVVLALGSRFGGWSFFVQDGTPVALMAASQLEGDQSRVVASGRLPAGKSVLSYQFVSDGGVNAGGEMRISVDGREIGRGRIARTISKLPEMTDTLDIGFDADTPVTAEYRDGGRFNGTLSRVDVRIDR